MVETTVYRENHNHTTIDEVRFGVSFSQPLEVDVTKKRKPQPDEPLVYTVAGIIARAGGARAVAEACGVTQQSVSKWGRRIPAVHAEMVATMAGLALRVVRPDLVREVA